jgi:uncharacterized membrane protein
MEIKSIYIILHILGAVVGAGGAFYSDLIFFKSLKDKRIDTLELSFLRVMSLFVWVGLSILVISGAGLFFTNTEKYLHSTKFIAKMAIVLVIVINGMLFHIVHIPFMKRRARLKLRLFVNTPHAEDVFLVLSGIISMVSWIAVLILGSLQLLPFEVHHILGIYTALLAVGSISSAVILKPLLGVSARRMLWGLALVRL